MKDLLMKDKVTNEKASLTFLFVTLSFEEMPMMLCCHLWCAATTNSSYETLFQDAKVSRRNH